MIELDVAKKNGLIDFQTYDWSVANGFYPSMNRAGTKILSVCAWGCFEKSTRILSLSESNAHSWLEVSKISRDTSIVQLDALEENGTPEFKSGRPTRLTIGPEEMPLYVFKLENGETLKLTQNHGVLLSSGIMAAAKDVRAGDEFLQYETGTPVQIIEVSREKTEHDVFNFKMAAENKLNHIVVANGVLVGDLSWQNELSGDLGAVLLRR